MEEGERKSKVKAKREKVREGENGTCRYDRSWQEPTAPGDAWVGAVVPNFQALQLGLEQVQFPMTRKEQKSQNVRPVSPP